MQRRMRESLRGGEATGGGRSVRRQDRAHHGHALHQHLAQVLADTDATRALTLRRNESRMYRIVRCDGTHEYDVSNVGPIVLDDVLGEEGDVRGEMRRLALREASGSYARDDLRSHGLPRRQLPHELEPRPETCTPLTDITADYISGNTTFTIVGNDY